MQIYHVETQEDYDALMVELSEKGYKTFDMNISSYYNRDCCVNTEDDRNICHANKEYYESNFNDIPIQNYKAKQNDVESAIETVSQNNAELFHKIITDLEQTYLAKNKDYGNSFEKSLDKRGRIAGLVQLEHKMNRADEIMQARETKVKDETEIDTYLDMAVYNVMMAMWLMKQEG